MQRREIIGLALFILAIAFTPFAYGATFAFGFLAFAVGITGVILFITARPWRSRTIDKDECAEVRSPPLGVFHGAHGETHGISDAGADGGSGDGDSGGGSGGH